MKNIILLLAAALTIFIVGCSTHAPGDRYFPPQQKSAQPFTDSEITTKVKSTFIAEKLFGSKPVASMTIHVETINGVVYLWGTADNRAQAREAVHLARSVSGVVGVKTRVTISPAH